MRLVALSVIVITWSSLAAATEAATKAATKEGNERYVEDPFVRLADSLCEANEPPAPAPGSLGMDPETGRFIHPVANGFEDVYRFVEILKKALAT